MEIGKESNNNNRIKNKKLFFNFRIKNSIKNHNVFCLLMKISKKEKKKY